MTHLIYFSKCIKGIIEKFYAKKSPGKVVLVCRIMSLLEPILQIHLLKWPFLTLKEEHRNSTQAAILLLIWEKPTCYHEKQNKCEALRRNEAVLGIVS